MALYRLEAKPVQRSKGQSATAGAAYRSASVIRDERTGQTHDYQRKLGVFHSEIITQEGAMDWTRHRPQLWNKAELAEKQHNGQPAREILLALPCELTDEQKIALVSGFAREAFVDRGMVADVSLHRADRHGDERNDHAHIMLTMRELDGEGFSKTKNRDWNKKETLQEWREQWEAHANRALEAAGVEERVDHRSLEARGIEREPTEHLGSAASAMERDGITTVKGDRNRETERRNGERAQLVAELAEVEAEIKRQSFTRSKPQEPDKKGLRYVEWYAMRPEPPLSQEEQERQAVSAFTNEWTRAYMAQEPPKQPVMYFDDSEVHNIRPEPEEPLSWEATQAAAQSNFEGDVTRAFEQDIMEHGEVAESGLGRNWYDRTVTAFENLYYDAVDLYRDTIEQARDYWQQYVVEREKEKGIDKDPDQEPDIDFDR